MTPPGTTGRFPRRATDGSDRSSVWSAPFGYVNVFTFLLATSQPPTAREEEIEEARRNLAAHGLFRRDNPLFSAIRLFDSRLTLLDLYHLPLSAELVVLSGCSTGLNVVIGGDELLGLMRGVLLAGAHGVMVSLWDVKDISTAQCMERFYRYLLCGSHKAAALQRAMQELREEYPHPYFWAPFLLAGRYTPVA